MMRKLLLLVLLLCFNSVLKSQNIEMKIKYDIINCYIQNHEIPSSDKQKIFNDFDGFITIKELLNAHYFNGERKGIYSISLRIRPTSRLLFFFYNNNSYYIMPTDSLNIVFTRFISYINESNNLTKKDIIKYMESIIELNNDNLILRDLNKIPPPAG